MTERFAGKRVIVTGGASGIGAAAARRFAAEGAKVVIADRQPSGEQVVQGICSGGGIAVFQSVDLATARDCEAMVRRAVDSFGGLDIAFNNGAVAGAGLPAADEPEDSWNRIVSINMKSVYLSMKYEIAAMLDCGGGVIVNTSSVAGLFGEPGAASYSASKHGVIGMSKSAALDYIRRGIRINVLCPGGTNTEMLADWMKDPDVAAKVMSAQPIGRLASPDEIAGAALFLASEESSFMVGHAMVVDGGLTI